MMWKVLCKVVRVVCEEKGHANGLGSELPAVASLTDETWRGQRTRLQAVSPGIRLLLAECVHHLPQ